MPWTDNSDDGKPGPKPGPWGGPSGGAGDGPDAGQGAGPSAGPDGRDDPLPPPRRPSSGPRRGPPPPINPDEITVLLRRWREQLEGAVGGAGGQATPHLIGLAALALVVLWLIAGVYFVQPAEQGVVTTFGAYSGVTLPGPHWRAVPFQRVQKVQVAALQRVDVGGTGDNETPAEALMLTGDENIVDLTFTVQYRINDPAKYLFRVSDPGQVTIQSVAESAMREVVGKTNSNDILTNGRGVLQDQTEVLMQRILDSYGAGVTIVEVQVRSANPPKDVVPDFQDVASAGQDAASAINQANAYKNRVTNVAKGDAAQIIQSAQAYREQVVRTAQGDASRFNQIYEQYRRAPAVTRERLYLEAMERVLAKSNKVIVDTHGATAPIILPSDAFRPRPSGAVAQSPPDASQGQQAAPPQPAPATTGASQ
jgi:membrane protease subunit HflK